MDIVITVLQIRRAPDHIGALPPGESSPLWRLKASENLGLVAADLVAVRYPVHVSANIRGGIGGNLD